MNEYELLFFSYFFDKKCLILVFLLTLQANGRFILYNVTMAVTRKGLN